MQEPGKFLVDTSSDTKLSNSSSVIITENGDASNETVCISGKMEESTQHVHIYIEYPKIFAFYIPDK